jgi:hypothetical protein
MNAKGLANQLLTFAKGGSPVLSVLDIRPLITQAASFASRGTSSQCVFELGDQPLTIEADRDQIAQVISNLVINATQAMPSGGKITVKAAAVTLTAERSALAAGHMSGSRCGTGRGHPQQHLPHIFDPLTSTAGSTRDLLSIVTRHGARSSPPPSQEERPSRCICRRRRSRRAPGLPAAAPGAGRILIMDDDAAVARVLRRMLESQRRPAHSSAPRRLRAAMEERLRAPD